MRFFTFIVFLVFLFSTGTIKAQRAIEAGELIVQLKEGADPNQLIKDFDFLYGEQTNLKVKSILSPIMRAYLYSFDAPISEGKMLNAISMHEDIMLVQFNHKVSLRETIPNDPQFNSQWQHINSGQTGGNEDSDIDSEQAWDITTGGLTADGDTIVVCVIEGANLNHVDLVENKWVNYQEIPNNGIDDDGNGYVDDYEGWNVASLSDNGVLEGGHGTNVAGMIGAKGNNSLGVAGINWDVKIMSVAGESISNEASVIAAYNYPLQMRKLYNETNGASGAYVVATNASWGADFGDPADIPIWCNFYDTLGVYGILNCGATSNLNINIDLEGDIPTACPSDYMISVTATDHNDVRTFSGYGATTVDLGAPGEDIFTTSGSNNYTSTSGTSFASPLTAGVIALLYSIPCNEFITLAKQNPQSGANMVREALFNGTDPVPNLQNETVTGGRLNAHNSLLQMMAFCGDSCLVPFGINSTATSDTSVVLSWGGAAATESYDLRFREIGETEWTLLEGLEETTFSPQNLNWCSTYEFQVKANCGDEESAFSNSVEFTTGGCCEVPQELFIMELDSNTALLTWDPVFASTSFIVEITIEGQNEWITIDNFEGNEVLLTSLDECTRYEVRVQSVCADTASDFSGLIEFRTHGCGSCIDNDYCEISGEDTGDEFIERIAIGPLENESGNNGGYAFFDSEDPVFVPGEQYDVELEPGYTGFSYSEYFRVWIDYNADGIFQNSELAFDPESTTTTTLIGILEIPEDATPGLTRMRIAMKYIGFGDAPPTPCATFNYGEVEDYCIRIDASSEVMDNSIPKAAVFPNPSNSSITIQTGEEIPAGSHITILDAVGRLAVRVPYNSDKKLDVSALSSGYYHINIEHEGRIIARGKFVRE